MSFSIPDSVFPSMHLVVTKYTLPGACQWGKCLRVKVNLSIGFFMDRTGVSPVVIFCQPGRLPYLHYCKNPIPYNLSTSQLLTLCFLCALCVSAVNYYP